jgi:hypothetical protein
MSASGTPEQLSFKHSLRPAQSLFAKQAFTGVQQFVCMQALHGWVGSGWKAICSHVVPVRLDTHC